MSKLFTVRVMHGLDALQYLLECKETRSCSQLANKLDTTTEHLQQVMRALAIEGYAGVLRGPGGGYYVTPVMLSGVTINDVLKALGQPIALSGSNKASARLHESLWFNLEMYLGEFLMGDQHGRAYG